MSQWLNTFSRASNGIEDVSVIKDANINTAQKPNLYILNKTSYFNNVFHLIDICGFNLISIRVTEFEKSIFEYKYSL